jgi:hypothetical protein
MLDRIRAKVAAANLSNVEVVLTGFLIYEHSGEPADFIYSRVALHHLPDAWTSGKRRREAQHVLSSLNV